MSIISEMVNSELERLMQECINSGVDYRGTASFIRGQDLVIECDEGIEGILYKYFQFFEHPNL